MFNFLLIRCYYHQTFHLSSIWTNCTLEIYSFRHLDSSVIYQLPCPDFLPICLSGFTYLQPVSPELSTKEIPAGKVVLGHTDRQTGRQTDISKC